MSAPATSVPRVGPSRGHVAVLGSEAEHEVQPPGDEGDHDEPLVRRVPLLEREHAEDGADRERRVDHTPPERPRHERDDGRRRDEADAEHVPAGMTGQRRDSAEEPEPERRVVRGEVVVREVHERPVRRELREVRAPEALVEADPERSERVGVEDDGGRREQQRTRDHRDQQSLRAGRERRGQHDGRDDDGDHEAELDDDVVHRVDDSRGRRERDRERGCRDDTRGHDGDSSADGAGLRLGHHGIIRSGSAHPLDVGLHASAPDASREEHSLALRDDLEAVGHDRRHERSILRRHRQAVDDEPVDP